MTKDTGGVEEERMQNMIQNIVPIKRWISTTKIGQVVAFLCSPQAASITGVALPIDSN